MATSSMTKSSFGTPSVLKATSVLSSRDSVMATDSRPRSKVSDCGKAAVRSFESTSESVKTHGAFLPSSSDTVHEVWSPVKLAFTLTRW